MRKHVLFVFHGMGKHAATTLPNEDDSWIEDIAKILKKSAGQFSAFSDGLESRVELVPITYDQVFHTILTRWDRSVDILCDKLGTANVSKVVDWMQGISSDQSNFFWTNIVDVLLWRFFDQARDQILARTSEKLVSKIAVELKAAKENQTRVRFSVLAHSLGTSVAHDTLQRLATTPISDKHGLHNTALFPANFQFYSFFTLANVSRILWPGDTRVEQQTKIRPTNETLDTNSFYLGGKFINIRHVADPIPAFGRFSPKNWGDKYISRKIRHYRDVNVHGYSHYLTHPLVYGLIFRGLLGSKLVPTAEIKAQLDGWHDYQGSNAEVIRELVTATEGILARIAQIKQKPNVGEALVHAMEELFRFKDTAKSLQ